MRRNVFLDYIRGLSALSVVLYHYTVRYVQIYGSDGRYQITFPHGSYAVHVFFILSGYLTISKIGVLKAKDFAVQRFLRLYPVFWIAATLTMVITRSVDIKVS